MTRSETLAKFCQMAEYYGKMARPYYTPLNSLDDAGNRDMYQVYNAKHLAWSEAADLLEQMED